MIHGEALHDNEKPLSTSKYTIILFTECQDTDPSLISGMSMLSAARGTRDSVVAPPGLTCASPAVVAVGALASAAAAHPLAATSAHGLAALQPPLPSSPPQPPTTQRRARVMSKSDEPERRASYEPERWHWR